VIPINNYLIITAIGGYQPEVIIELSRACAQCGCNINNMKMSILGKEVAIILFVSGNWGAIAKMEATLPALEQRLGLHLATRRTTEISPSGKSMSYTLHGSAIDKPGILNSLSEFLYERAILIEEISTQSYMNHIGTQMVNLTFKINIPETVHLASFREQFMSYCDDSNLDAFLEPMRHP
jgi:glycine cleavage system transcriptional repressor